jgi:hypothetical protein
MVQITNDAEERWAELLQARKEARAAGKKEAARAAMQRQEQAKAEAAVDAQLRELRDREQLLQQQGQELQRKLAEAEAANQELRRQLDDARVVRPSGLCSPAGSDGGQLSPCCAAKPPRPDALSRSCSASGSSTAAAAASTAGEVLLAVQTQGGPRLALLPRSISASGGHTWD